MVKVLLTELYDLGAKLKSMFIRYRGFYIVLFAAGIIIHFYILSNTLYNHDSIVLYGNDFHWLITQGKWFVTPLASIEGCLDLSYLAQIICLIFISLAAVVFSEMFELRHSASVILAGLFFLSFPAVATMAIYHAGDYFGIIWFFSITSAYLISRKGLISSICGIVLLVLSLGGYQPYMGFTISLLALDCLIRLLRNVEMVKIIKTGFLYIAEIILSIGIYYAILQYLLRKYNLTLSSYKGLNSVNDNIKNINSVIDAIKYAYIFLFRGHVDIEKGVTKPYYISIVALAIIGFFIIAVRSRAIKKVFHMLCAMITLVFFIPLGINITGLLTANQSFYFNSIAPFVVFFVIPLVFSEVLQRFSIDQGSMKKLASIFTGMVLAVSALVIIRWVVQDNIIYQKLEILNNEYNSKFSFMAERINESVGYSSETPIVLVGKPPYQFLKSSGKLRAFEEKYNTHGARLYEGDIMIYSPGIIDAYLKNKLSIQLNVVSGQNDFITSNRELIESMPTYPSEGFAQLVDGKMIVKLSDTFDWGE